jgi:hypothetical protein
VGLNAPGKSACRIPTYFRSPQRGKTGTGESRCLQQRCQALENQRKTRANQNSGWNGHINRMDFRGHHDSAVEALFNGGSRLRKLQRSSSGSFPDNDRCSTAVANKRKSFNKREDAGEAEFCASHGSSFVEQAGCDFKKSRCMLQHALDMFPKKTVTTG